MISHRRIRTSSALHSCRSLFLISHSDCLRVIAGIHSLLWCFLGILAHSTSWYHRSCSSAALARSMAVSPRNCSSPEIWSGGMFHRLTEKEKYNFGCRVQFCLVDWVNSSCWLLRVQFCLVDWVNSSCWLLRKESGTLLALSGRELFAMLSRFQLDEFEMLLFHERFGLQPSSHHSWTLGLFVERRSIV